jgi:hypothetical protein
MIKRPQNNPRNGDNSGSPRPKKFKTHTSSSYVLASVYLHKDGTLLVDYLVKGATIVTKYYVALLNKLKQQLVSKRGILCFQDSAPPHKAAITYQKLGDVHFEVLNTQPTHLILPLWTTASFLTSRNISKEEDF